MIYTLKYRDITNNIEVEIIVRKYTFSIKGGKRKYIKQLGEFLEWLDIELKDLTEGELMEILNKEFEFEEC